MTNETSRYDELPGALRDLVPPLPPTGDLFDRVAEVARRRHRRRTAGVLVAFGIVAVAVAVATPTLLLRDGAGPAASVSAGRPTPPAAGTCPSAAPTSPATSPTRAGAATALVPDRPLTVTVCGALDGGSQLTHPVTLIGSRLERLVDDLNALPAVDPQRQPACPVPPVPGNVILATFAYRSGPAVQVRVDLPGCAVTNGTRQTLTGAPVTTRLSAAVDLGRSAADTVLLDTGPCAGLGVTVTADRADRPLTLHHQRDGALVDAVVPTVGEELSFAASGPCASSVWFAPHGAALAPATPDPAYGYGHVLKAVATGPAFVSVGISACPLPHQPIGGACDGATTTLATLYVQVDPAASPTPGSSG